jgi:hypothetical protein
MRLKDIQIILTAICEIEGWDSNHDSIKVNKDGSWSTHAGLVNPSQELLDKIREIRIQRI